MEFITVKEAAKILGKTTVQVYAYINKKMLTKYEVLGVTRLDKKEVKDLLKPTKIDS
jgi:predicted DNA-binding transcriptional regulator AlpA